MHASVTFQALHHKISLCERESTSVSGRPVRKKRVPPPSPTLNPGLGALKMVHPRGNPGDCVKKKQLLSVTDQRSIFSAEES